jgi:ankyrin repeat protein
MNPVRLTTIPFIKLLLLIIFLSIRSFSLHAQNELELLKAAEKGDSLKVRELLKNGTSPNTVYVTGETAVILAAKNNHPAIVKDLIEGGAFVNFKSKYGNTALMFAVNLGNFDLVKFLVDHGADVKQDAAKLLIFASHKSSLDILKYLIETHNLDVNLKDEEGKTALIAACMSGSFETVKYLLEKGAEVNVINDTQDDQYKILSLYGTPLMHAATRGRVDVMKLLIEKKAKIDIKTNLGNSALILSLVLGKFDAAKLLIENGAYIEDQDKNGYTPLMHAGIKNSLDMVQYLVEKGSIINMKNKKGKTVYDILLVQSKMEKQFKDQYASYQTKQVLKYLKKKGAKKGEKV